MASYFGDKNYDPRRGLSLGGRVRKEDFSIDGKSWDYRDPYNAEQLRRQNSGAGRGRTEVTVNQHSQSMTNPLYEYSYGQVRDAAKDLNINNVNNKEEVDQILNYIRGGSKAKVEEPKEEAKDPEFVPYSEPDPRGAGQPSANQQQFGQTGLTNSGNESTRPTFSDDPMKDAMNYGADLTNDYEQKFIPSLLAEAKLGAKEIGESTRYHISNFVGKVPELGDPREMLDYYEDRVFGDK